MVKDKTKNTQSDKKFRIVILEDRCKGCKLCVSYCPTETLGMSNRANNKGYFVPEVINIKNCKGCDLCSKYCPDFAIYCEKPKKKLKK